MEGEIIILKKKELQEMLEAYFNKIAYSISKIKQVKSKNNSNNQIEKPEVKRLYTTQIKQILGISDSTFEKIQDDLPLHRTKTGRMFAYKHDLIVYLFREHPPFYEYSKFEQLISEKQLLRHLNSQ